MAEQEVGIRIRVDADEATRRLHDVAMAEKSIEKATDDAGRAAKRNSGGFDELNSSVGMLAGRVSQLTLGLIGGAGLAKAMGFTQRQAEAMLQSLEQSAAAADKLVQAMLDLHALSFKYNPEDEQFVQREAESSGRPIDEVGSAYTGFKSATGHLNPQQQREIFHAAVTVPGMATAGGLAPLATFAARASRYESDPQKLANMMAAAVQQGGEPDPATLFEYGSQLLESGKQAGLEAEDTLGLLAFGSKGMPTAQAATQLRNVMLRLQLDANTGKVLRRYGVNEAGFFDKLDALRQKDVSGADLVAMVGIENSGMLSSLLSNYDDVQRIQAEMDKAKGSASSIYGDFLEDMAEKSPQFRTRLKKMQEQQAEQNITAADQQAMNAAVARSVVERHLRAAQGAGKLTPREVQRRLKYFDDVIGRGGDPVLAARGLEVYPEEGFSLLPGVPYVEDLVRLPGSPIGTYVELDTPVREALRSGPTTIINNITQYGVPGPPELEDSGRIDY